jgi:hypothetical protein
VAIESTGRASTRRTIARLAAVTAFAVGVGLAGAGPAVADHDPTGPSPTPASDTTSYAQGSSPALARQGGVRYAVPKSVCPAATKGRATCMAVRLIPAAKGTKGAKAITAAATTGPAGGYSPSNLASAYGYNRAGAAATQTVAIVDAYDNPTALQDLNTFNSHYGLPAETATSFVKVNQAGDATPLPPYDAGWATEIALDIQTVRAVCNKCKILLVEASLPNSDDLAAAVNTAADLGATEISNSYGAPEDPGADPNIRKAYQHPGVVITASTGDDGWYGWDWANAGYPSDSAPSTPSSYPEVVAVGGTALSLNTDGTRHAETVWNENGLDNKNGWDAQGATGGGCSRVYSAPAWQAHVADYFRTGCGSKRMVGDIAVVADPNTGFDVYNKGSWLTIGGTSLSAPIVAAMWALAGGSGGVDNPAQSLYYNLSHHSTSVYDVTVGGNSYCGGDTQTHCAAVLKTKYGTGNPNNLIFLNDESPVGLLDCAFDFQGSAKLISNRRQCLATAGYDGPSGVGTPKGLAMFTPAPPTVAIQAPALKLNVSATFNAASFSDPVPGATAVSYHWNWGDGQTTDAVTASATHAYTVKGSHTIALTVTDTLEHKANASTKVTVGVLPVPVIHGAATVKVHTTGKWTGTATDSNTGGTIVKRAWKLDGNTRSTAASFSLRFNSVMKHNLTYVVVDNAGLRATKSIIVTVIH